MSPPFSPVACLHVSHNAAKLFDQDGLFQCQFPLAALEKRYFVLVASGSM